MYYVVAELERIGHNISDVIYGKRSPCTCKRLGSGDVMSHLANTTSIRNTNIGKMHRYANAFKDIVHHFNTLLSNLPLRQVGFDTQHINPELDKSRQGLLVQNMLHPTWSNNRKPDTMCNIIICRKSMFNGVHWPTGRSNT